MNDDTGHVAKVATIELSGKSIIPVAHKNVYVYQIIQTETICFILNFNKQIYLHSSNSLMTRVTIKIGKWVLDIFSVPLQTFSHG